MNTSATDGSIGSVGLLVIGAGVTPESAVARQAGLQLTDGRVVVDERMATAWPGVSAAGDVAFARNAAAGRSLRVERWGEAHRTVRPRRRQARVATPA